MLKITPWYKKKDAASRKHILKADHICQNESVDTPVWFSHNWIYKQQTCSIIQLSVTISCVDSPMLYCSMIDSCTVLSRWHTLYTHLGWVQLTTAFSWRQASNWSVGTQGSNRSMNWANVICSSVGQIIAYSKWNYEQANEINSVYLLYSHTFDFNALTTITNLLKNSTLLSWKHLYSPWIRTVFSSCIKWSLNECKNSAKPSAYASYVWHLNTCWLERALSSELQYDAGQFRISLINDWSWSTQEPTLARDCSMVVREACTKVIRSMKN